MQYRKDQYHLIRIDVSEEIYHRDVAKAINMAYTRYRGRLWNAFSPKSLVKVEYVKYGKYSDTLNSFQMVEPTSEYPLTSTPSEMWPPLINHEILHFVNLVEGSRSRTSHDTSILFDRLVFDERKLDQNSLDKEGYALLLQYGVPVIQAWMGMLSIILSAAAITSPKCMDQKLLAAFPMVALLLVTAFWTGDWREITFLPLLNLSLLLITLCEYLLLDCKTRSRDFRLDITKCLIAIIASMFLLDYGVPEWIERVAGLRMEWTEVRMPPWAKSQPVGQSPVA